MERLGASATAATLTMLSCTSMAKLSSPSVMTALMDKVKLVLSLEGGVMAKPVN